MSNPTSPWTRESLVAALELWAELHDGRGPRQVDWRVERFWAGHPWPSFNHVVRAFGSWNAGILAAGLEPTPMGRRRPAMLVPSAA